MSTRAAVRRPTSMHECAFSSRLIVGRRREPSIIVRRLHLHNSAFRYLAFAWPPPLYLLRRILAEVEVTRALVSWLSDAEHLRLERRNDGVKQAGKRPIGRSFACCTARGTNLSKVSKVRLHRRR